MAPASVTPTTVYVTAVKLGRYQSAIFDKDFGEVYAALEHVAKSDEEK